MITTLVSLAVSMTAGTAVLSWFEPDVRIPRRLQAEDASFPVELVDFAAPSPSDGWQAIRIHYLTQAREGRGNIPLTARRSGTESPRTAASYPPKEPGPFHFQILEDGTVRRGRLWHAQRSVAPDDDAIAIGLVGHADAQAIPTRQWLAARTLLDQLAGNWTISPERIGLDQGSDPARCPDCPAPIQDLADRLYTAGYMRQAPVR